MFLFQTQCKRGSLTIGLDLTRDLHSSLNLCVTSDLCDEVKCTVVEGCALIPVSVGETGHSLF